MADALGAHHGQPGYVYLIHSPDGDQHKIGKSANPRRRFQGMQLPAGSALIHTIPTSDMSWAEGLLHHRYATQRLHGEWFRLTSAQVAEICAIQELDPTSPRRE